MNDMNESVKEPAPKVPEEKTTASVRSVFFSGLACLIGVGLTIDASCQSDWRWGWRFGALALGIMAVVCFLGTFVIAKDDAKRERGEQ